MLERVALVMGIIALLVQLFGGFRFMLNEWRNWRNKSKWLVVVLLFIFPSTVHATIYYVDITGGNDASAGTSTGTAWKHLRCMPTVTGGSTAATTTPVAGDSFIFKGGETWNNADFPCTWNWSGTAGNVITIGVDATWFTGGAWTRPIWDAGGTQISGGRHAFLDTLNGAAGVTYLTVDNFEIKGYFWSGAPAFGDCEHIAAGPGDHITLDHLYVHGWTHGTYASGTRDDSCYIILGNTNPPYMVGSILQNSVIDGSDSTGGGDSIAATYAFPSIKNTIMHDLPNMVLPSGHGEISGNHLYNCTQSFDAATHNNLLQTIGADGTYYIHDNVIHNGPCETFFIGNPNETAYVWNNVIYNSTGNPPAIDQSGIAGTSSQYWWNNTIVPTAGGLCLRSRVGGSLTFTNLSWQNNHCITTNVDSIDPLLAAKTTTYTSDHNLLQTPAAASTQGYTSSQSPYVYFPTPGGSTIDAGIDLSSNCSGSLASLCVDTTYGSLVSGTQISGAARTALARNTWDVGAYEFYLNQNTPVVIGRVVRWMELILPIMGLLLHARVRHVVMACCVALASSASMMTLTTWMGSKMITKQAAITALTVTNTVMQRLVKK